MILIIILIIFAGVFKAVADTLVHHFSTSIFKNCTHSFFDPSVSWLNKYNNNDATQGIDHLKFQPFSDAWHLANSISICCWCATPFIAHGNLHGWLGYLSAGIINIIAFDFCYTYLFRSR